jgi:hypothetical protein
LVDCRFFEILPKTKKRKELSWNEKLLINNLKEWGDAISAFSILFIGILQSYVI